MKNIQHKISVQVAETTSLYIDFLTHGNEEYNISFIQTNNTC